MGGSADVVYILKLKPMTNGGHRAAQRVLAL